MIAARQILAHFERRQREVGHAAESFLSATHGFLPIVPPTLALPASHVAWDELAAELPGLFSAGRVARRVAELPELSAAPGALAAEGVCRASLILGVVAHALVRERDLARTPLTGRDAIARFEPLVDGGIPQLILTPWRELGARLEREGHCLSFGDLVLYNWCLVDAQGERTVDNMRLLVPTVDIAEEHRFYLTFVETHALTAPLVDALVRAQESVARDDASGVRAELDLVGQLIRRARIETLHKIDPNPHAPGHVDPVAWSRLVAPLAAPTRPGEAGLSGGGAPLFHMLDAFFGRNRFDTKIGREVHELRKWLSPGVRAFVQALETIDVASFVKRSANRALTGAWGQALEAYVGEGGWLSAHRMKVYGFMEVGFKAGRTQTNGGFSGALEDRAWEKLDRDMDDARRERYREPPQLDHATPLTAVKADRLASGEGHHVVLSLEGSGLRYEAGDRCAVLARNERELVERTCVALRATGDEPLALDRRWKQRLAALGNGAPPDSVSLRDFLTHAQLRPLDRRVVERLRALSSSLALQAVLDERREDQVELWDVLAALAERYDVRRLWLAGPWERESLARLIEPMRLRVYSIASAPDGEPPRTLHLSVRALTFSSRRADTGEPADRRGAASTFLSRAAAGGDAIPIRIVTPTRFRLPDDPATPIVMFAGGSGVAPFRAFWQTRARASGAGAALLFVGAAVIDSLLFRAELEAEVAAGRLVVEVISSREDRRLTTIATDAGPRLVDIPGRRGHIDLLLNEWRGRVSALFARDALGYVCGRTGFALTVQRALERALGEGSLLQLVARGRMMFDLFTTFAPANAPGALGDEAVLPSELARKNDDENGWWMAIQGRVYDVEAFLHTHPGGARILRGCAGTNATASYERVEHHLQPEVHAMLDLMKTGHMRHLDFGGRWGVSLGADGIATHGLEDVFRAWVGALYALVELQNGLRNNEAIGLRGGPGQRAPGTPTWLKARLRLEQLATFDQSIFDALLNETFPRLWELTSALVAPHERLGRFDEELDAARRSAARWPATERERLDALLCAPEDAGKLADAWAGLDTFTALVERLLAAMKALLVAGVSVFERHERETVALGGAELIATLTTLPSIVARYRTGPAQ